MLTALTARYVFPVSGPPIEDGVVVVDGNRIREVDRHVPASAEVVDLNERNKKTSGGVAILPGLVNAHTHLEFSDLKKPLGEAGMAFADWIREVIAHRIGYSAAPDELALKRTVAIERGLLESLRSGSTTIGEIAPFDPLTSNHASTPARCVVFREWLGLGNEQVAAAIEAARQLAAQCRAAPAANWHPALSPHAPYSTHWRIVEEFCRIAQPDLPVAMHLAESPEELQLLAAHDGPFRPLLDELELWNPEAIPRGGRPMDYLKRLAAAPRALVIHGNYLDDAEIAYLAEQADHMSVVFCPRTHAWFQHEPYPLANMLAAGVNVALGTDSRASNPDLSLLAEMRHVARHHPKVSHAAVLRMGTLNGARALGVADRIGTLEPGKQADLAVIALPDETSDDAHALLILEELPSVVTLISGQEVN